MTTLLAAIAVIGLVMFVMALGFIFQKKSLRGSCGGSEVFDCDGESLSCAACPNRQDGEGSLPRRAASNELIRELMGGRSPR